MTALTGGGNLAAPDKTSGNNDGVHGGGDSNGNVSPGLGNNPTNPTDPSAVGPTDHTSFSLSAAPQVASSNIGWQPSGDGQVVKGSMRNAKVLPVDGATDPQCAETMDDHSHDIFKDALPDVTVWFGDSADGPWDQSETLPANACGWRRLYCEHTYDSDTGPKMMIARFIKVQAFYVQPARLDVFPPTAPDQQASCPLVLDCGEDLKNAAVFDLQLVSGLLNCSTPRNAALRQLPVTAP